jgi:hypothetical protein
MTRDMILSQDFSYPEPGSMKTGDRSLAHCCLGPYWAERLGKTAMKAYQASNRGGVLKVTIDGTGVIVW